MRRVFIVYIFIYCLLANADDVPVDDKCGELKEQVHACTSDVHDLHRQLKGVKLDAENMLSGLMKELEKEKENNDQLKKKVERLNKNEKIIKAELKETKKTVAEATKYVQDELERKTFNEHITEVAEEKNGGECDSDIKEATGILQHEIEALERENKEWESKYKKLNKKIKFLEEDKIKTEKDKSKPHADRLKLEKKIQQLEEANAKFKDAANKKNINKKSVDKVQELQSLIEQKTNMLAKTEEDLSTCETKKATILEQKCEDVQSVGFSVDVEKNCEKCTVDVSLFTKIFFICYDNLIKPYREEISIFYTSQHAVASSVFFTFSDELQSELYHFASYSKREALDMYYEQVTPFFVDANKELSKLYKDFGVHDYVNPVNVAWKELEVYQKLRMSYSVTKELVDLLYDSIFIETVIPALSDFSKQLVALVFDLSELKSVISKPLQFPLFDEILEFKNGFLDVGVLFAVTSIGIYTILYQFCFKFVFLRLFFSFFLNTILYKGVILGSITIVYWIVRKFIKCILFLVKLSFCCGCCGLCFKRKKVLPAKPSDTAKVSKNKRAFNPRMA